ncbi:membrane protein [Thermoactinomyces vulgaris]|jgi:integral membrane protein|nr:membrane protein [Thermoactinomyces vulgaris]
MLKQPLGRLRVIGFLEGMSYLILLFIAMPMKYLADYAMAVTITGGLHGLLFVLFIAAVGHVAIVNRWSLKQIIGALIASVIPFGTFVLDKRLKESHSREG